MVIKMPVESEMEADKTEAVEKLLDPEIEKILKRAQQERILRKKVFEIIVELSSESSTEEDIIKKLPYLDVGSWDEMVEERYIARMCGLPSCSLAISHRQSQLYHIDRKDKKIYEKCGVRDKFCGVKCFSQAVYIRAQLDSQPLWLTGEGSSRMKKRFDFVPPNEEKSPSNNSGEIEFVEDNLIAQMTTLKIAEREDSTEDEASDSEEKAEMNKIKPSNLPNSSDNYVKVSAPLPLQPSILRSQTSTSRMSDEEEDDEKIKKPSPIDPQHGSVNSIKFSVEQQRKLDRLRQKYSRNAVKKLPLLIDASPVSPKIVKEIVAAEKVVAKAMEEPAVASQSNIPKKIGHCTPRALPVIDHGMAPCNSQDIDKVSDLLRSWWTDRTTHVLHCGGLRPKSDINELLQTFLAGGKGLSEVDEMKLPEVDSIDVQRRRLRILFQHLKPSWMWVEQRLGIRSSQKDLFWQLMSTFNLNSENIAGFQRIHCRLACIIVFRAICRTVQQLEEDFFPGGYPSSEIYGLMESCGLEEKDFTMLCNVIPLQL